MSDIYRSGVQVYIGAVPILLSAPHAAPQVRRGSVKPGEPGTAILANDLVECMDVSSIVRVNNVGDDPNFDRRSPYRDRLASLATSLGAMVVLDLHQLRVSHRYDLIIGTGMGANIFQDTTLVDSIVSIAKSKGLVVGVDIPGYAAVGRSTVSRDISQRTGVPCLQIEVNSRFLWEPHSSYNLSLISSILQESLVSFSS